MQSILAQAVIEGELELDRLACLLRRELDRKNHLVAHSRSPCRWRRRSDAAPDKALRRLSNSSILTSRSSAARRNRPGCANRSSSRAPCEAERRQRLWPSPSTPTVPLTRGALSNRLRRPRATRRRRRQGCDRRSASTSHSDAEQSESAAKESEFGHYVQSWLDLRRGNSSGKSVRARRRDGQKSHSFVRPCGENASFQALIERLPLHKPRNCCTLVDVSS